MDQTTILNATAIVLSLAFKFYPPLEAYLDTMGSSKKPLFMALLTLLTAVGLGGLSCLDATRWTFITCDWAGWANLAEATFWAFTANQVTYLAVKHVGATPDVAG